MSRTTILLAVLAAVLVSALWWVVLYSPGQAELARIEDEIAAAEAETLSLQQRVAGLEAIRARAPETEAAIARLRSFVPDDPALPAALRQLQAAADDAGVTIEQVSASRPSVDDEAVGLYRSTLSLTVTGSYFQVVDFLRRLEDPEITSRGITLDNVGIAPGELPVLTVSLTGSMYAVLDSPPAPEQPGGAAQSTTPTDGATEADEDGEES